MNDNNLFWKWGKEKLAKGDREGAFTDFAVGNSECDAKATFGLAIMYYHGWAVDEDRTRAQELFDSCFGELQLLANVGDGEAAFILYRIYDIAATERFVPADDILALEWLERAAELHDLDGCLWLAIAYLGGSYIFVDYDPDYAIEMLEYCVEQNMAEAMVVLGEQYIYDDISKAKTLFERAVALGNEEAAEMLKELDKRKEV